MAAASVVGLPAASADPIPVLPGPTPAPTAPAVTPAADPLTAPHGAGITPVTPTQVALAPATSGTLFEYFDGHGVKMEPQQAATFRALSIALPVPTGWTQVPDPNVPDAFAVIADRNGGDGLYTSNAQLTVYKLVGEFDPNDAITHGFIDAQALPKWQTTDASLQPYGGFPSSRIEGTFRENDSTVNTFRRHVIASTGTDRYLVSLSVNTSVNQVVASADATDAIANGFRVTDPAAAPAAPAPGQPTAPGPNAPAQLTQPAVPGQAPAAVAPSPVSTIPGRATTTLPGASSTPLAVPVSAPR
ncbi:LpqN/LpqT family lipoprotein [Mycolicibacterium brumae]|uniref:Proline-rich 28 kDa antigen n=1 Tax=Mycolicibacterium brumae TaxID=85968 RepID=A0A2G5P626_9MYCO|nr:LpqN/LpqT family lipoprotein [Mycolicibacterium brumae]MCV7192169.1 LpqN/LpqT family lipoprotein [Mycolicibacterium brumae]PIB73354.1 hypothetical protein CQY22_017165 [Mycolicibacterium brumae]UWW10688.1 LpqN/LpqT family lipoprotein [Mycolicibacterium brumae]